jgi:hypothetical protein
MNRPFDAGAASVNRPNALLYGLVIAVDIEGFSKLDTLGQTLIQQRLSRTLSAAADHARLDRDSWYRQARGDGELAVVPMTVDPSWVVAHFTEQLITALAHQHSAPDAQPLLRLRVAMHLGTMSMSEFGPAGDAPIVACRLLDAPVVRRALATERASDLVLAISDRLYHDVVRTRFHGLAPERFRPFRVTAKGTLYRGQICADSPRDATHDEDDLVRISPLVAA